MRYSEALEMVRHVQALARVCKCSPHEAARENAATMAGVVRVLGVHLRGLLVNQDPRGAVKDWGRS